MHTINFILKGFGFNNWLDFKVSSFGFVSLKVGVIASLMGTLTSISEYLFGFKFMFLFAYFLLIVLEWSSGVVASRYRGEKHESRKLGRMVLKVMVYTLLLFILNTFARTSVFPKIMGYEIDPFTWLYWIILLIIIWQLVVSLLENFESLGFKWSRIALKVINKKFYQKLEINENDIATKRTNTD